MQWENELLIGGRWIPGGGPDLEVEDPTTEKIIGVVTQAAPDDVEMAVAAARRAACDWAQTSIADRAALLRRIRDTIAQRADLFAETIHREQGSPLPLAQRLHVATPLSVMDATINALERFSFTTELDNSTIVREPVGVVAAITPWNLPLHQVVAKVFPALAAGATVVLKPAELTPITAFEMARAFDAAGLPAGVLNLVVGGPAIGQQLVRHPGIDQISFTGSTSVGRSIAVAAASNLTPVTLELGGKSASVVLAGTDPSLLTRAVKVTVGNCYLNAGQTCTALSRMIVPADLIDQAAKLAAEAAAKYVPGPRMGPLISAHQRAVVESYLDPTPGGRMPSPFAECRHHRVFRSRQSVTTCRRPCSATSIPNRGWHKKRSSAPCCLSWPRTPTSMPSPSPTTASTDCPLRCGVQITSRPGPLQCNSGPARSTSTAPPSIQVHPSAATSNPGSAANSVSSACPTSCTSNRSSNDDATPSTPVIDVYSEPPCLLTIQTVLPAISVRSHPERKNTGQEGMNGYL